MTILSHAHILPYPTLPYPILRPNDSNTYPPHPTPTALLPLFLCCRYLTGCGFRLPGEAQKVDRFVEVFVKAFWQDNQGTPYCPFRHPDTVHLLAYATIMLNTDLHRANIDTRKKGPVLFLYFCILLFSVDSNLPIFPTPNSLVVVVVVVVVFVVVVVVFVVVVVVVVVVFVRQSQDDEGRVYEQPQGIRPRVQHG